MRLGVLAGSVVPLSAEGFKPPSANEYGVPSSGFLETSAGSGSLLVLARHGTPPRTPPHMVNHRANIRALQLSKVDAVVSVCSCGALKKDMMVPSWAVPDDLIDLSGGPTFLSSEISHITPAMDNRLMERLFNACEQAGIAALKGGTYVQTKGPRLETKAEVRLFSQWGDYVGMNMAPEAVLSMEADIPYAALLTVDNYANGVVEGRLDFRDILASARRSWDLIIRVLGSLAEGPWPDPGMG